MKGLVCPRASVLALALLLASCGGRGPLGTCPEGPVTTDRALVAGAVHKIVVQTRDTTWPGVTRYRSDADFFARNPDCCFVTRPQTRSSDRFALPLREEVELALRYRARDEGEQPYALRYVTIGPCSSNMEEGDQRLTAAQYEASRNWRWDWRVR